MKRIKRLLNNKIVAAFLGALAVISAISIMPFASFSFNESNSALLNDVYSVLEKKEKDSILLDYTFNNDGKYCNYRNINLELLANESIYYGGNFYKYIGRRLNIDSPIITNSNGEAIFNNFTLCGG